MVKDACGTPAPRARSASSVLLPPLSHPMVLITVQKRPLSDAVDTQRKFFRKTAKGKVVKGPSITGLGFRSLNLL